ncbi:AAA domain-containing protein [Mycoplasmopsis cynos]|uniref:AAA domain-containing protein n=1 Tax=Mycoplasmopsis cynos TaxID=171284 RepID=UPI0024C9C1BD|nr:AAA domain-containing protein [Mycoplasmopsis cynos]WAM06646.1 AAA domain-containing protein [Mycoplasmopsis cynos]
MKSEDALIKKTMSILKELISKYKDKYSVGIVVFNVDIVNKVENELEKFIHNNPKLNYFFDENKKEPFFIKNIDAVQGDERDFIFFIIEGKKNANQRVSVNFGAINREDSGYKRLNVAISRAKKGLILISNFNSSEVDWHKSDKRGIQLLEQFFKNAEYGIKNDVKSIDFNKSNASFIDHVYNELSKRGLSLKKNIGSSSFKIDIAIIDNNNPDNFLLAINCDGNSYKLAKTDRDRDRLMQQILESRGWNFIRIWSVDWYKNPQKQLNLILNKVKEIIENNTSNNLTQDTTKKIPKISYIKENKKGLDHIFSVYPDVENLIKKYSFEYRQSTFINQKAQIAKNIIDVLAPISFEAFLRIIRDLNEMNSVNKAIKLEALKIVNKIATFDDDNEFILSNEKDDNKYKFRISTNQNNKRSIQDIYEPELVDIILTILSYNDIPTDLTAIVKEICVKTQTMRVTTQITNRIKDLINKLVLSNKILKVDENTYQIVK